METQQHIAILGSGNIGLALAKGLVKAGIFKPQQITLTRRNITALAELEAEGYNVTSDNALAVNKADIVVLAILPQQLNKLLDEFNPLPIKQNTF
jgi:pyrroline-5-carboxylate reductase